MMGMTVGDGNRLRLAIDREPRACPVRS